MGKKSLLKSTSKKKNAKVKTDSDKKSTPAGEASEVKAEAKKAQGSKKQAATEAAPAKAKPAETKKAEVKAEVKKEKPLSIKELVLKKFDTPKPGTLFTVKADDSGRKSIVAPPFVSGLDPAETERVRKLLFKTFDLSVPDPAPVEPEPIAPAVEEKAPEPEVTAAEPEPVATVPEPEVAAAPAPEAKEAPAIEIPKPPQRPLPIGLDFPKPPTVPTLTRSNTDPVAAQTVPTEPKKSMLHFLEGLDPMIKKAIGAGCGLATVFLLISIASFSNMSNYYLEKKGDTVEVWQGRFAPLGADRIAVLTDAPMMKEAKSAYSRAEVVPLIVENFVSRADELMVSSGVPDFVAIQTLLKGALSYADGKEVREGILQRLDRIDMTALVFKATVSAGMESRQELEAARGYLTKAALLAGEKGEKEMIQQKLKAVSDKLGVSQPAQKGVPGPSAPPVLPTTN